MAERLMNTFKYALCMPVANGNLDEIIRREHAADAMGDIDSLVQTAEPLARRIAAVHTHRVRAAATRMQRGVTRFQGGVDADADAGHRSRHNPLIAPLCGACLHGCRWSTARSRQATSPGSPTMVTWRSSTWAMLSWCLFIATSATQQIRRIGVTPARAPPAMLAIRCLRGCGLLGCYR